MPATSFPKRFQQKRRRSCCGFWWTNVRWRRPRGGRKRPERGQPIAGRGDDNCRVAVSASIRTVGAAADGTLPHATRRAVLRRRDTALYRRNAVAAVPLCEQ
jgi:hypothetical protein